jgi:hypothetical protein
VTRNDAIIIIQVTASLKPNTGAELMHKKNNSYHLTRREVCLGVAEMNTCMPRTRPSKCLKSQSKAQQADQKAL